MIEIEKGIPIPVVRHEDRKYPFAEMEVGDSFLADISPGAAFSGAKSVGIRVATRTIVKGKTIRVWRVK